MLQIIDSNIHSYQLKNNNSKVELLSPAGNLEKLKIAINYGADAVYGGVSHFSLRNRAGKEFTYESFLEGIKYVHQNNKKIYVTINGFPFNSQIKLLKNHIAKVRDMQPDAFIVSTIGVMKLCKEIAPNIPIHISTQANVLNVLDAKVFFDMGAKRIVAAREISLKDIIEIKKEIPKLEIEIFCHGSMCFAFSGRCLISSLQSGRVPNRGSCANDCRFDYEFYVRNPENGVMMRLEEEEGVGTYIFNAKDLNLSQHLYEILKQDVINAIKIEGRTKSAYYTAITTRTYRMILDDFKKGVNQKDLYEFELNTLKNRGFSDGYIIHRPYEKLNTQNTQSAISDGSYQVTAKVDESGEFANCNHTIRIGEAKEIITPIESKMPLVCNEIGEIYKENNKFFINFNKIIFKNGREVKEIHSGNINPFKMPIKLPPFSFIRQKLDET
ncbi:peptidase U32 family protein [Helicobacter sp. MIT 14-3879]|uniref:peptidase U32 family protein n=1 Tax=Helicobacter sp. MIT 14-3879 TaxID=2040649 RepID=UPI000E1FA778|nr:peptidase U32 family protein [Helicobacter sp. MIT 14-3879]RDU64182.1 collagenase-like protease [Helicobacter sp. MIT 14-3879]